MDPIDFGGQRSRSQWTYMEIKLVNMIETKPLSAYWLHLVDMLAMVRGWTLWVLEVNGQKVKVTMDIYGDKLVNTIETKRCVFLIKLTSFEPNAD